MIDCCRFPSVGAVAVGAGCRRLSVQLVIGLVSLVASDAALLD